MKPGFHSSQRSSAHAAFGQAWSAALSRTFADRLAQLRLSMRQPPYVIFPLRGSGSSINLSIPVVPSSSRSRLPASKVSSCRRTGAISNSINVMSRPFLTPQFFSPLELLAFRALETDRSVYSWLVLHCTLPQAILLVPPHFCLCSSFCPSSPTPTPVLLSLAGA